MSHLFCSGPKISTHALREEGDVVQALLIEAGIEFLPTPSARRATRSRKLQSPTVMISTHALREEGDS